MACGRYGITEVKERGFCVLLHDSARNGKVNHTTYLDPKAPAVNIISKEQVVVFLEGPTDLKYLHEIILENNVMKNTERVSDV